MVHSWIADMHALLPMATVHSGWCSGADSYFTLHSLFATSELVLKPRFNSRPSLEINLYISQSNLESEVSTTAHFLNASRAGSSHRI